MLSQTGRSYTYGDSSWGDLLTGYGDRVITSDTIGNTLSDGKRTYTWEHGRQLSSVTGAGYQCSYVYNADGLRVQKTVNGTVHYFVYSGDKLVRETYDGNVTDYFYDANGNPYCFKRNGTYFFYITNIQGDVIRIADGMGSVVATYEYDAWGNIISASGSAADLNPLRYRGYYYDQETGLYYLQSRYYDPEIGRFISPDAFTSTGQGFAGNNMFVYCNNNPYNSTDYSGRLSVNSNTVMICDGGSGRSSIELRIIQNLLDNVPEAAILPEISDSTQTLRANYYQISVNVDDLSLALMGKDSSFWADSFVSANSFASSAFAKSVAPDFVLPVVSSFLRYMHYKEMPELPNGTYDVYSFDTVASETIYYNGGTGYMEMLEAHVVLTVYDLVNPSGNTLGLSVYHYTFYNKNYIIGAGRWDVN